MGAVTVFSTPSHAQAPATPDATNPNGPKYFYVKPPTTPPQTNQPQPAPPPPPPGYQYTPPPPAPPLAPAPAAPPSTNYQYQAPAADPPPSTYYQQPAAQPPTYQPPVTPPPPTYQQQPASSPPPAYQTPPPVQEPYQQRSAPPVAKVKGEKEPSLIDDVQGKLVYHAKRATVMSLPALGVLAIGLVVGGIVGAVIGGALLGFGVSSGLLNADGAGQIGTLVLIVLPAIPIFGILIGGAAYAIARVITVALVSMFYPGEAETMDDRLRNMRVSVVADLIGHVASMVGALSIIGFVTVVSAIVSSFLGLAALISILQNPTALSVAAPIPLLLVGLGVVGLFMAGGAFVTNILLAHVGLPISTVVTKALVFGDADRE